MPVLRLEVRHPSLDQFMTLLESLNLLDASEDLRVEKYEQADRKNSGDKKSGPVDIIPELHRRLNLKYG